MILKYSRIYSFMFTVTSLAIGIPLVTALANHNIASELRWIAWIFVVLSTAVLIRWIWLLASPPTMLEIIPDGIQIYCKKGGSFSKNADLLPWRIIDRIQLVDMHGKAHRWVIELTLGESVPFNADKRNAYQSFQPDPNFFFIKTRTFK